MLKLVRIVPLHGCWVVTPAGNMPARDDLYNPKIVNPRLRAAMLVTMKRHLEGNARRDAVKPLRNEIWEFRAKENGICLRVLYFTESPHCVGAHTFVKKDKKTPDSDIEQARRAMRTWSSGSCPGADW